MKKKALFLTILVIAIFIGGLIFFLNRQNESSSVSLCKVNKMTYYYLNKCPWCQKIKQDGTLEKLEEMGVKIKKVNIEIVPTPNVSSVPTFSINNQLYTGYKTFDELKDLLGCPAI